MSQGAELWAEAHCPSQRSKAQLGVSRPCCLLPQRPQSTYMLWWAAERSLSGIALPGNMPMFLASTESPLPDGAEVKSEFILSWCLLSDSLGLSLWICTLRGNSTSAGSLPPQVRGRLRPARSEVVCVCWTPGRAHLRRGQQGRVGPSPEDLLPWPGPFACQD